MKVKKRKVFKDQADYVYKESISSKLKRVLKEQLNEQEETPVEDFDIPEPPSDGSGDADGDADGDLDTGGDLGGDATSTDGDADDVTGDSEGLEGDDTELTGDGGGFDFGGVDGFGGGSGGFDFGGGDDGEDFGDEGEDAEGADDSAEEEVEPVDPVEFAVEEAKKLAEENGNIQQILTTVKSIITDKAITPDQLNSIVSQLKAENDVVLSAVSNRLLMFAKGF